MKRFSMLMLMAIMFWGLASVGRAIASDEPKNPPPKQDGGAGGPPHPGYHLIPRFAMEKLELTDDQKKQVADLEKEVTEKLAKILTADQMKTLESARPPRRPDGGNAKGGPDGGDSKGQPRPPSN